MTRPAALRSARVAWRHSLRFRLALVYTLVALALISVIGLGVMTLLLRQMDTQFQTRLNERADSLAEAFVKTLRRDYARAALLPDAPTILGLVPAWIEDYNASHPHSGLRMLSPREFRTRCA